MSDQSPIEALIERAGKLTLGELTALAATWHASDATLDAWAASRAALGAAWDDAMDATCAAARDAAWAAGDARASRAAWDARAAGDAAWDAALALALRGKLARKHYDALTRAWALVVGPVHPDDPDRRGGDPDA
jgi:hypothetical protein